jgi:hypothetical protein
MSYTLPANVLDHDGALLRVTAWGVFAASATAKQVLGYFDGTAAIDSGSVGFNDWAWKVIMLIARTGASTQDIDARFHTDKTTGLLDSQAVGKFSTDAADETGTIVIKIAGNGTNANDIIQHGMMVEILN